MSDEVLPRYSAFCSLDSWFSSFCIARRFLGLNAVVVGMYGLRKRRKAGATTNTVYVGGRVSWLID